MARVTADDGPRHCCLPELAPLPQRHFCGCAVAFWSSVMVAAAYRMGRRRPSMTVHPRATTGRTFQQRDFMACISAPLSSFAEPNAAIALNGRLQHTPIRHICRCRHLHSTPTPKITRRRGQTLTLWHGNRKVHRTSRREATKDSKHRPDGSGRHGEGVRSPAV